MASCVEGPHKGIDIFGGGGGAKRESILNVDRFSIVKLAVLGPKRCIEWKGVFEF